MTRPSADRASWERNVKRRRTRRYAVNVTFELHARVRAEAERHGISMQRLIDIAIRATVPEVRR